MVLFEDDRVFWVRQIMEHQYFMTLYFSESEVIDMVRTMLDRWNEIFQTEGTRDAIGDLELISVMSDTIEMQSELLMRLKNGEFLGAVYPSLLEHFNEETEYAIDKVAGNEISDEEEYRFWNDVSGDHAMLDAHMLDPKDGKDVEIARELGGEFHLLKDSPEWETVSRSGLNAIQLSVKLNEELNKFHRIAEIEKPPSIIHPLLLEHMLREGERAMMTLRAIE